LNIQFFEKGHEDIYVFGYLKIVYIFERYGEKGCDRKEYTCQS
jgi:hypothetical protein